MEFIDSLLDRITMYRVVLYYLIALFFIALVFSFFGILSINPFSLVFSLCFFIGICALTNRIFSWAFDAPTNIESVYITAFILFFIISPAKTASDLPLIFWVAVLSMATKYILAINKKHIFNPAAVAVVLTSVTSIGSASWWIGTSSLAPFVLIGGILVVKKLRREDFVFTFFLVALTTIEVFSVLSGNDLLQTARKIVTDSSLLFLGFVMLTEPLTTPPTRNLQIVYGALVGFLFAPQIHFGNFYPTPEIALCMGNVFSFIVSPRYKLMLNLKEKIKYGTDILDFNFFLDKQFLYLPGQYMEWTLPHKNPDSRGNRRYFTIASSPTEDVLHLGVKFSQQGSSFKKNLADIDGRKILVGGNLSGDFTLPSDKNKKLVFIAGGIGITPYRSIIKYLIDTKEKRDIVLMYSNKFVTEIVYKEIFDAAQKELGIKSVYTLTDEASIPSNWNGEKGRISADMIAKNIPDYKERLFYLSGPHTMIESFEKVLKEMGVKNIKKDYFPGLV